LTTSRPLLEAVEVLNSVATVQRGLEEYVCAKHILQLAKHVYPRRRAVAHGVLANLARNVLAFGFGI
jgi:hypothetical protein